MTTKPELGAERVSPFVRAKQALKDSHSLLAGTRELLAQSKKLLENCKQLRKKTPSGLLPSGGVNSRSVRAQPNCFR